ncbi:unnamed protein product [Diabrotica balteata]|uniref:Vinculin n=1 Tax=Diabrotica balteata TaxID=107213 RepID=A0A9N9T0I3_DIABA|nr:unnamed protein product [Diabrotica balteata]
MSFIKLSAKCVAQTRNITLLTSSNGLKIAIRSYLKTPVSLIEEFMQRPIIKQINIPIHNIDIRGEDQMKKHTFLCEEAIKNRQPQKMVDNTSAIARLANRVLLVAKQESDNSEDQTFISNLNRASDLLQNAVPPMVQDAKLVAVNPNDSFASSRWRDSNKTLLNAVGEVRQAVQINPDLPPLPDINSLNLVSTNRAGPSDNSRTKPVNLADPYYANKLQALLHSDDQDLYLSDRETNEETADVIDDSDEDPDYVIQQSESSSGEESNSDPELLKLDESCERIERKKVSFSDGGRISEKHKDLNT